MYKLTTYLGHKHPEDTYIEAVPELLQLATERAERCCKEGRRIMTLHPLPILLERFFTDRLVNQMDATANTVDSYRRSFVLLLKFARDRLGREPTDMLVTDIDAELVGKFLDHIENERSNTARSRNTRLMAVRSFFNFVAINEPGLLHHCQQVLALPAKRYEKPVLSYLEHEEIEALLTAPNLATWYGRRDRTILHIAVQTGLRVSELIGLDCGDVHLGTGADRHDGAVPAGGRLLSRRSLRISRTSTHMVTRSLLEARRA